MMDSIWILIIWPLNMNPATESPQYVESFDSRKECVEYYESNLMPKTAKEIVEEMWRHVPPFECVKIPKNPAPSQVPNTGAAIVFDDGVVRCIIEFLDEDDNSMITYWPPLPESNEGTTDLSKQREYEIIPAPSCPPVPKGRSKDND